MINIPNKHYRKVGIDELIDSICQEKKISEEQKTTLKKSITLFHYNVINHHNGINNPNDHTKLLVFEINLRSDKNINSISKIFFSLLGKQNPMLLMYKVHNIYVYAINTGYLNDEGINQIVGKLFLISPKLNFEFLKTHFNFLNLNNSSVINLFNDIIYHYIFIIHLQIPLPFKRYIPYDILLQYHEINKLQRQINGLNNKLKHETSKQSKIDINLKIKAIRTQINEIKEKFDKYYNSII